MKELSFREVAHNGVGIPRSEGKLLIMALKTGEDCTKGIPFGHWCAMTVFFRFAVHPRRAQRDARIDLMPSAAEKGAVSK